MLWYHRYLIDVLHDSVLIFSDFKPLQMLGLDLWGTPPYPLAGWEGHLLPHPTHAVPFITAAYYHSTSIFTEWMDSTDVGIMEGACHMCAAAGG